MSIAMRFRCGSSILIAASALLVPFTAFAVTYIEAVPTAWRLQDYLDGSIATWYTGASCTDGHLILAASAPNDSKQRYWSIIMAAKISQKKVGVYYDNNNGTCTINSFYLKEE